MTGSTGPLGTGPTGPTGQSISILNPVANRVLTAASTSAIVAQAQSNLTFDGTTLTVTGNTSNTLNITSGNFTTITNSSNSIGGVLLSNGYMRAGGGSVSGPGISFLTDTSAGMYLIGANQIGFTNAGVNRMTISNSNVGIGQTAPTFALDLWSPNTTNLDLRIEGGPGNVADAGGALAFSAGQGGTTSNGVMSRIKGVLTNAIAGSEEQGGIAFQTRQSNASAGVSALTERMRITHDGFVGIGTTAPTRFLDISSGSANPIVNLNTSITGTGGANGVYYFGSNITGGTLNAFVTGKNTSASNNGAVRYTHVADGSSSNYISLTGAGAAGINVNQSGNVGIGTTAPAYTLDISAGATANTMRMTAASYPSILFQGNNDVSSGQILYDATVASNRLMLRTSTGTPITFESPGNTERMRLTSGGLLGIGIATPGYTLDVNGNAGVRSVFYAGGAFTAGNYVTIQSNVVYNETATGGLYIGANPTIAGVSSIPGKGGTIFVTADGSRVGMGTVAPRAGYLSNAANTAIPSLDVSGQVFGRLPIVVHSGASATSLDLNVNFNAYQNTYFYLTNSGFNGVTLPTTTSSNNGGIFFQLKNSTSTTMSVTVTGASSVGIVSPVTITPSNAITFVVSPSSSNTFLLF